LNIKSILNSDYAKNVIRTFVPSVVGAVVAFVTKEWGHVPTAAASILFPVVTGAYYATVRYLEVKYPSLSWLLGSLPVKAAPVVTPTASAPPVA